MLVVVVVTHYCKVADVCELHMFADSLAEPNGFLHCWYHGLACHMVVVADKLKTPLDDEKTYLYPRFCLKNAQAIITVLKHFPIPHLNLGDKL